MLMNANERGEFVWIFLFLRIFVDLKLIRHEIKPRVRSKKRKKKCSFIRETRTLFFFFLRTHFMHIRHKYINFHILRKKMLYICYLQMTEKKQKTIIDFNVNVLP